ncbi:MBL fold metallo-hydrolase [Neobacillus notoginsengisoli]|uniref:MBL fold metallo-hydrolase n=1 Tax=Neobacillus notoginsengisoli TaxID=1578198 RepID=A0A417YYZ6_9BACI|nr:MBL fold metallo-hydrolase [Neobacillus notoginsengisoli]RHW43143.1 MBL fold metallo-hydrolase [Neobacillus notoginsengisoli]
MKLTVIGYWGGYPKKNGASTGYLLEHDGYKLLIDCGSGVLAKLQNVVQPEELDAVILSHYHPDHVADIGVLYHARLIQGFLKGKLPVLPIYGHGEDEGEFKKLTHDGVTNGFAYEPNVPLQIGPFDITFLKTVHPVPCYAMRFEAGGKSLVYTADTAFNEEFIPFSKNAEVLLAECNFYADQSGQGAGHMTSTEAGKLAKRAEVGQLILTHLPHYGDIHQLVEEASQEFSGQINLAEEFMSIEL